MTSEVASLSGPAAPFNAMSMSTSLILEDLDHSPLNEHDEDLLDTLDLSGQGLEKLTRAVPECQLNTTTLLLDRNKLQRLDNLHSYQCIEKVRKQLSQVCFIETLCGVVYAIEGTSCFRFSSIAKLSKVVSFLVSPKISLIETSDVGFSVSPRR